MNNEIGRKLTSLTLMTIMLAGGMVIAAPSMVPEAAAAGALYVSAENAQFNNTFGGAQVIEVIVIDPNRSQTDEKQGEPVVKVDENLLRMAQGVDGNWYGYFGDKTSVAAADTASNNLDFGIDDNPTGVDVSEAVNVYINATDGVVSNPPALSNYNNTVNEQTGNGVAKSAFSVGQIGVQDASDGLQGNEKEWPFIQLYDFTMVISMLFMSKPDRMR